MNITEANIQLRNKSFLEIIEWSLPQAKNPVITTNFRPYEGAILHAVSQVKPDIKVIWCDTGYNTAATYKVAEELIKKLSLNIETYVPKQTVAFRNNNIGIPSIGDPNHKLFSDQVKLEPFLRAMKEHKPDFWFTNIRKGQTEFRNGIDVVSKDSNGTIKVSPFYH
jgi:phosphoadenosine phosphosulfate reductase